MVNSVSTPPIIQLSDITYTYPGNSSPVLHEASLAIHEGDHLALIGDNGSGKTTLFHIIMGLLSPDAGYVNFRGNLLRTEKDFHPLRQNVGLLLQQSDDQLFCPTILEDVAFGPLNLGKSPDEARSIAEEMLVKVGFTKRHDKITYRLSGGEKKIVALAAVLAMQPSVLLLDEPTNDLDPATRERLIEIIHSLDLTRLLISHDWDFLQQTCATYYMVKNKQVHTVTHAPHVHVHTHAGGDVTHAHTDTEASPKKL